MAAKDAENGERRSDAEFVICDEGFVRNVAQWLQFLVNEESVA